MALAGSRPLGDPAAQSDVAGADAAVFRNRGRRCLSRPPEDVD